MDYDTAHSVRVLPVVNPQDFTAACTCDGGAAPGLRCAGDPTVTHHSGSGAAGRAGAAVTAHQRLQASKQVRVYCIHVLVDMLTQCYSSSLLDGCNCMRCGCSEGDRLSGLIVDCLGDAVVVSSSSAFIERRAVCSKSSCHCMRTVCATPGACTCSPQSRRDFACWLTFECRVVLCYSNKQFVTEALRQTLGTGSILWRPSVSMLQEEGIEPPAQLPEADAAEQQVALSAGLSTQHSSWFHRSRTAYRCCGQSQGIGHAGSPDARVRCAVPCRPGWPEDRCEAVVRWPYVELTPNGSPSTNATAC
jgi:hypothetical protein